MRRFPFLTNADRRALLWLECLIILVALGVWVFSWKSGTSTQRKEEATGSSYQKASEKTVQYAVEELPMETFPFDPNTADSTALLRLGLAPWQVRSIYRYRAKHGRYHTTEDFKRLPGLTHEQWERLAPYVRIDKKFQYVNPGGSVPRGKSLGEGETKLQGDSSTWYDRESPQDTFPRIEKYEEGTVVDLNKADTADLKRIPGIASYRASRIVAYRERLGGFENVEQVMEACEMPDDVMEWMKVENPSLRKIDLNSLSIQKMMRHPYINFYQAKAIWEYRRDKGRIENVDQLREMKEFSEVQLSRLLPYLDL